MSSESTESLITAPREAWPSHIAIIMDGNGRWAQNQGLPRMEGHRRGVTSVRRSVEECARLKIDQLTLYCLSSENWKRPRHELDFLMHLLEQYMIEERALLREQDICVRVMAVMAARVGVRVGICIIPAPYLIRLVWPNTQPAIEITSAL